MHQQRANPACSAHPRSEAVPSALEPPSTLARFKVLTEVCVSKIGPAGAGWWAATGPGHSCAAGSVAVLPCVPGSVAPLPSMPRCVLCSASTYQSDYGQLGCNRCEAGAFCKQTGLYTTGLRAGHPPTWSSTLDGMQDVKALSPPGRCSRLSTEACLGSYARLSATEVKLCENYPNGLYCKTAETRYYCTVVLPSAASRVRARYSLVLRRMYLWTLSVCTDSCAVKTAT